jgi:hypothetical protein
MNNPTTKTWFQTMIWSAPTGELAMGTRRERRIIVREHDLAVKKALDYFESPKSQARKQQKG